MAKTGTKKSHKKEPNETEFNRKLHVPSNDEEPTSEIKANAKHGHQKAFSNLNNARPEENICNKGAPHPKN